jgi:hypothetical protein
MPADLFRQTAPTPPYSAAATALADALEDVMSDGTHDLPGIVAALNKRGTAGSTHWTPETLTREIAALANA